MHAAIQVGDEPLQYKRKFPDILVAVSESRTFGIPKILMKDPQMQLVFLDDAFQHRSIKPGLNILLTEYSQPFTKDFLLPSGRLREWRSAYRRADVIIVSKCPAEISEAQRKKMVQEIAPHAHQQIYFSYYTYQKPYYIFNHDYKLELSEALDVLLICAIARTNYLLDYLELKVNDVKTLEYEDHHTFTNYDVSNLKLRFARMNSTQKLILTTEKDAVRLELHREYILSKQLPIFVLPAQVTFCFDDGIYFNEAIKRFLLNFRG